MKYFLRQCLPALGCFLFLPAELSAQPGPGPCEQLLQPYRAEYDARYHGFSFRVRQSLRKDEQGRFVLTNQATRIGTSVREESIFTLRDDRIRVQHYRMSRAFLGIERGFRNHYDWAQAQVRISGDVDIVLPLEDGVLDLLSYQQALRCDLARGMRRLHYTMIAEDRLRHYSFQYTGTEKLAMALGERETLVVERRKRNGRLYLRFWVAPDLDYMILRMEKYNSEGGISYSAALRQYRGETSSLSSRFRLQPGCGHWPWPGRDSYRSVSSRYSSLRPYTRRLRQYWC